MKLRLQIRLLSEEAFHQIEIEDHSQALCTDLICALQENWSLSEHPFRLFCLQRKGFLKDSLSLEQNQVCDQDQLLLLPL